MRTILAYGKPSTSQDAVSVRVLYDVSVYGGAESFERYHTLSDTALVARALDRGASTWDEDDLCAELDAVLPPNAETGAPAPDEPLAPGLP